jgi:hypothetical protein
MFGAALSWNLYGVGSLNGLLLPITELVVLAVVVVAALPAAAHARRVNEALAIRNL